MRTLVVPVFLLLIFVNPVYAQTDFRDGFIITTGNDTLKGKVDFRSNAQNYKSCVFRDDQVTREYLPDQIKGFGYVNDRFFSSEVVENAFVEVLVSGDISLYRHKEFFLIRKGDQLYELEPKKKVTDESGQTDLVTDNKWRGILSYFISDCLPNPSKWVSRLTMQERDLTDLVTRYNLCRGNQFTENKTGKPWTLVEAGIALGASLTNIRTDDLYGHFSYLEPAYTSVDPEFGGIITLSSPRITENLAFQGEIQFRKSSFQGYVEIISGSTVYNDTYINLTTLSVPLSVKYTVPVRNFRFFALGGLLLDHQLQAGSKHLSELEMDGMVYTDPEKEAFSINNKGIGYQGGVGLMKKTGQFRSGIFLRYARLTSLSQSPGMSANPDRISLQIIFLVK